MKKILTMAVISATILFSGCTKKENNDDENFLTAALLLASSASNCNVTSGSTTLSLPFVTATTTAQNVSFTTSNGTSLGVVVAKNLAVGAKVVFTGNATASAYPNNSSSGCNVSASGTVLSTSLTQTSTNPASFTVLIAQDNTAFLVSGTGTVTVQIQ